MVRVSCYTRWSKILNEVKNEKLQINKIQLVVLDMEPVSCRRPTDGKNCVTVPWFHKNANAKSHGKPKHKLIYYNIFFILMFCSVVKWQLLASRRSPLLLCIGWTHLKSSPPQMIFYQLFNFLCNVKSSSSSKWWFLRDWAKVLGIICHLLSYLNLKIINKKNFKLERNEFWNFLLIKKFTMLLFVEWESING